MSWNQPNADDFIIADEEPIASPHVAAAPTAHTDQPSQAPHAGFGWTPKVDLSTAFTPFITSNFQESNTVRESQYSGGDTLDEPVWHTLRRDLVQILRRLAIVVWPAQLKQLAQSHQLRLVDLAEANGIRLPQLVVESGRAVPEDDDTEAPADVVALDWDLWGPLIFSLVYAVTMGLAAPNAQTNVVFSGTFSFIWLFYLVVGLNIQLLGGTISFLSAISATGYLKFPIVVGALVSVLFLRWGIVRFVVMTVLSVWSIYAAVMSLRCLGVLPGRVFLAIYPVALMYAVLSWLVVIT